MTGDSRYFSYELDARDCVVAVCREWDALANAFSKAGARSDALVGTPILSYFGGGEVRQLFHMLFARVRAKQAGLTVPFRCDSPTVRRFMELRIEPLAGRGLRVTSVPVREEPRPYVALLDCTLERDDRLLAVCAWCKKNRARWALGRD